MDNLDSSDESFTDSDSDINDELEDYMAELKAFRLRARREESRIKYKIKKAKHKLIARKEARKEARKRARKAATGTHSVGGILKARDRYRRNTHYGELIGHGDLLEDEEFELPYETAETPPVVDNHDSHRTQEEQLTSFGRIETGADVGRPSYDTVTIQDRRKLHRSPSKYRTNLFDEDQGQRALAMMNPSMAFTEQRILRDPFPMKDLSQGYRRQKSKKASVALAISWCGTTPLRAMDLDISSDEGVSDEGADHYHW